MNRYPIPEIEEMTKRTRRIGLGVMGFADLLVQLGISYDSDEALECVEKVMSFINNNTHRASSQLATKRGSYDAYDGSIYTTPMRNSAPTTIAPTGTISIIAGASSGIEPLFALGYERNVMDNTRLIESNPYFEAVAINEGFYSEELMEEIVRTGTLQNADVPDWVKRVFRTSHDISPEWHVKMQSAAQKYTDNAVSKTINFPHDATVEDVKTAYMMAYESGCKGITVYRDGSKDNQVLSTGNTDKNKNVESKEDKFGRLMPRQRPAVLSGVSEVVNTGHGKTYVTINFDENGNPFEIFGNQGKAGGCDSALIEAVARMASLALRSNIDPAAIVEQLQGITCCPAWDNGVQIKSAPDALAHVLSKYLQKDTVIEVQPKIYTNGHKPETHINGHNSKLQDSVFKKKCSDCNGVVAMIEGCETCLTCGNSKCE